MSKNPGEGAPPKRLMRMLNTDLSDRELHWIGVIVANWGLIETEIFLQSVSSYEGEEALPRELISNVQFTSVLRTWKNRVVDAAAEPQGAKLRDLHDRLLTLHEHRAAIVHGRWDWNPAAPDQIRTTRYVRQREIRHIYNAEALQQIGLELAEARYDLHYPAGDADRAREIERAGGMVISRAAFATMTGHPVAEELALASRKQRP